MIEAAVLFRIWNQVKKTKEKTHTHQQQQQQHQSKDIEWMNKRKLYILQTNLKNLYVEKKICLEKILYQIQKYNEYVCVRES